MLVGEGSHPDKVKVYGPGVEKTGLKANEPTYFTVDCGEAGQGEDACRRDNVRFQKNSQIVSFLKVSGKSYRS